eukprot:jgi/Tetstr1/430516/TSEL_020315.t1
MVERCTRTQLAYMSVEENTLQNRLTDEDMRGEYIHLPGGWTPTQSSNPALYRSLRHAWHWHTLLDVGADALAQYKLFLLDQPDLDGDIVDADTRLKYLRSSDSVWLQGAEDMLEIAAKQAAVLVENDDDGAMEPLLAGAHAEQFPLFQLMRLAARVGPGARPASVAHCNASDPAVCSDVQRYYARYPPDPSGESNNMQQKFALLSVAGIPTPRNFKEAMSPEFRDLWEPAIHKEYEGLMANRTPVQPLIMMEDNQGAISYATNAVISDMTKHIDIKWHFLKDHVKAGTVRVNYIATDLNTADMMTKPLPCPAMEKHARFAMGW